ncbi:hypothetical protein [Curtobacterium sp. ME26]|uniref:hypothetical protein n=1 Tax=Curtobacterium sp. ME26 TaxID=2744254 RepID=UPI0015F754C7|nr:hypothetical protein [Curtobacterium sp. ME26]
MNTEPPEGDELQRMLVSMKQTVLERAAPRPRRRHGRAGVAVGVVALLALGTATGAVALTLSQQDRPAAAPAQTTEPVPAPSATTPSSAPITGRPTPRPVPTPTAPTVATVPTSCRDTVPAEDYDRLFGATPLTEMVASDPDGTGTGTDDPELADLGEAPAITCRWMDPRADVSGLEMRIGPALPDAADVLRSGPHQCAEQDQGLICRATTPADPYPVDRVTTWFVRDDTYVTVSQTNFPTNGLLDAVVGEIWGD